jgi:regulator of sigma E protease
MTEFLMTCWTVVAALVAFGITIFVHELGHYLAAKTFSIGFGRALFKRERNGTLYKVGWIPFGGYVSLPQLDPEGMEKIQGEANEAVGPEISPWKKIIVTAAGPVGNVALAILLALVIWLVPGGSTGSRLRPVIGTVDPAGAAEVAGLRSGDEILEVNGRTVRNWYDISVEAFLKDRTSVDLLVRNGGEARRLTVPTIGVEDGLKIIDGMEPAMPCLFDGVQKGGPAARAGVKSGDIAVALDSVPVRSGTHFAELLQTKTPGVPVALTLDREGQPLTLSVIPEYNQKLERILIGVQLGGGEMPWMLYKNPVDQLASDALAIVRVLDALTDSQEASQAAKGLGGPVAIFDMLGLSIRRGVMDTLGLLRFLNVNLAVLNLLPIPVLDGGHILFALWCGVTRRRVNPKVQSALVHAFAALLISAMLWVTLNDIDRKFDIRQRLGGTPELRTESVEESNGSIP